MARNPYLEDTLARYYNLSYRIWNMALLRLNDARSSVGEQDEVLKAIESEDAAWARRYASRHVARFEQEMRSVL